MDIEITDAMREELNSFAQRKGSASQAALAVGVNPSTYTRWLKLGAKINDGTWQKCLLQMRPGYGNAISQSGGTIGNVMQNSGKQGSVTQQGPSQAISKEEMRNKILDADADDSTKIKMLKILEGIAISK